VPYPNRIQAALVFDGRFEALEATARDFSRIVELKTGLAFAVLEGGIEGDLVRLASPASGLVVRLDRVGGPPPLEPFEGALASAITGLFAPTARETLIDARSHVLVEVGHDIADERADEALARFAERLELLALLVRITTDHAMPGLIHWTQSDQLLTPDRFEAYALAGVPGPLHIHPHLFGSAHDPQSEPLVGVRSFGAVHWIGREVVVRPSTLPWQAAYDALLAFVAHASAEAGALIPDGDTFGSADGGECFCLHHRAADPEAGLDAAFEITPLRHDPSGFVSDEYAANAQIVKLRDAQTGKPPAPPEAALTQSQASPEAPCETPSQNQRIPEPEPETETAPLSLVPQTGSKRPARVMIRPTPSQPGETSVSGRSLRARVFGKSED
jgi:hypothetical protein